ncbi:protein PRY1-like isoform X2 [Sipha flava]|uniref:Protein PRY1-like isoform X2 n=1 Tax=Sipha flava TaxID=143950 RepID=A0A8B8FLL9_9HEMI|nr:protein PRY1-like isoform X2 [Sipha flava]
MNSFKLILFFVSTLVEISNFMVITRLYYTIILLRLNAICQDWADKMVKQNKASHRFNNEYGENIYTILSILSTNKVTELGVKAVDSWYSEIEFFDFQGTNTEMDASTKAFHFTQLIWKGSRELGVGVSKCSKSGQIYLVCNYNPRGNFRSQFKENVLPPHEL